MAKAKKKSAKEASETFHNIMAASVKGNPKPKKSVAPDITKLMQALNHIGEEIALVVPDYNEYTVMQISPIGTGQLFYNINDSCSTDKSKKIEKVILENAALLDLKVVTEIE